MLPSHLPLPHIHAITVLVPTKAAGCAWQHPPGGFGRGSCLPMSLDLELLPFPSAPLSERTEA